jgi:release factor glutamine methyltransferase
VLEVGAGAGLAAITAARCGAYVVATDLNPNALRYLRGRARDERLEVGLVRTDLARGLGRFDRLLANPPYLPTRAEERDPDRCRVTARLVEDLETHLTTAGEAFVVVSTLQRAAGLEAIRSDWARRGGALSVVDSRSFEGERLDVWKLWLEPG